MSKAKTMSRSRNQLASSYAPESFFTFEGGVGACISVAQATSSADLSTGTRDQIFERLDEYARSWFQQAMNCRGTEESKRPVDPRQCVDRSLLDNSYREFQSLGEGRVLLARPSVMGYTPAPLTFVCETCDLFRGFGSLKEFDAALPDMTSRKCPSAAHRGFCNWRQLDVIFVHWSGNWEPAMPAQYYWSTAENKVVRRDAQCSCGSSDYRLKRTSAAIGEWFFQCARCTKPLSSRWLQNDPETWSILGAITEDRLGEVRMQATPYRATNVYYVQSDQFIDFKESPRDLIANLRPGHEPQLRNFIGAHYGFGSPEPSDEDVRNACKGRLEAAKLLDDFEGHVNALKTFAGLSAKQQKGLEALAKSALAGKHQVIDELRRREILVPEVKLPEMLEENLRERRQRFAAKFDPFRLAAEHATLQDTRLTSQKLVNGKAAYVPFTKLDPDLAPKDNDEKQALEVRTREQLDKLGIYEMGLIREFELCRFSFGYTRMESSPVLYDKHGTNMPVRLNLFPKVRHDSEQKHPIYVVQQANEAIYVRLQEVLALRWLTATSCHDVFTLKQGEKIGAGLLQVARPMNAYLDPLPRSTTPDAYFYVYTLLHSYAHLLMKRISEYSGLDLGSLGEYIFPADLAFVVYRNGTTMDLGNLSAMWRNCGSAFLDSLLRHRAVQCGSGSLCMQRGGACPDCLMVPETSCIAGNKLLSRAVLRDIGGRPKFDTRETFVSPGYLDMTAQGAAGNVH